MKNFIKTKNITLAIIVSILLFIAVKAADSYSISTISLNTDEFPRVQASLKITGDTEGMLSKDIEVVEGGKENIGPRILLPPHSPVNKIDLQLLIDQSSFKNKELIRSKLKTLIQYLSDSEMLNNVQITSFDGAINYNSKQINDIIREINELQFEETSKKQIDGFTKINQEISKIDASNYQKVLLIVNSSNFLDSKTDGITGMKMTQVLKTLSEHSNALVFVVGNPIRKIHAIRADNQAAELVDFAHRIPGGYLGGFGADLSSMLDLVKMQSDNAYILQYYSNLKASEFNGAQASLKIYENEAGILTYDNTPGTVLMDHLPENEIVVGDTSPIELDLKYSGNMVDVIQFGYKNEADEFKSVPFVHLRKEATEEMHKYSLLIPDEALWDDNITYYISGETPYNTIEAHAYTIPVNTYNGIILTPQTIFNGEKLNSVLWRWTVPSDMHVKEYQVWMGDKLIATTKDKFYEIPVGENECDRYQVVQVKVEMPDHSLSSSKPYEYFADPNNDSLITERDSVLLMIGCIQEKEIDTYTKIAGNTPGFSAQSNLTLERAGIYLSKIIAEDIWRKIEGFNGDSHGIYSLLHYVMIFINRNEYIEYSSGEIPVKESIVYKLITKVNHVDDINKHYDDALNEIGNRLRGMLSM